MVGMLADRTFGDEATLPVTFLGATAYLPTGPMRAAAMLRRRVIFMLGLYRGGNRYQVVFEPLADFSSTPPEQRQAAIEAAITRYAALLEQYCRSDPYNWFNFFDFWRSPRRATREDETNPRRAMVRRYRSRCHGAGTAGLDDLMALLAQRRHGEADFREEQSLSILRQPLVSTGILIYDAPDHLEQRTLTPRPQSVVLDHGVLSMHIGTRQRTMRLADYPQLAPLIDSIRATLAGDRAALERVFEARLRRRSRALESASHAARPGAARIPGAYRSGGSARRRYRKYACSNTMAITR